MSRTSVGRFKRRHSVGPCAEREDDQGSVGRLVVFDVASYRHLARRRPWLLDHVDVFLATVASPDVHTDDPIPGRERYYRRHIDNMRWLRVVVDFGSPPGRIVTAIVQYYEPRRP
jgi:hypothetical protein